MVTDREMIVQIANHLLNGCGIRRTAHLLGISKTTVQRYEFIIGLGGFYLFDAMFRNLQSRRIEIDEAHTFIHTKQRHLKPGADPDHGDTWIYAALDAPSRAVIAVWLGKRTLVNTRNFIAQLRARVLGRPTITSDGYGAYLTTIERAFNGDVDFAVLQKDYEGATLPSGKRVAEVFVRSTLIPTLGRPDLSAASTSYVERFWGTARSRQSRLARKTVQHSKSYYSLVAAVGLMLMDYNFVRHHSTIGMTPAMALGIAVRPWSVEELVDAALRPTPSPCVTDPLWLQLFRTRGV